MLFQIKKEEVNFIFNFEGKEVNIKSKRNKYMKDIIEQYLITKQKDHKNYFFSFLYKKKYNYDL